MRKRLRRKEKKELIEKLKVDNDAQEVLFRFNGEKKISTVVTAPQINKFSDQLTNIYRLYCFKDKTDQKVTRAAQIRNYKIKYPRKPIQNQKVPRN